MSEILVKAGEPKELTLAIVRDVGIGMLDTNRPCMWFTTYTSEASAALQVLNWEEAKQLIQETGVYNIKELDGWPCWCDTSDDGLIKFIRAWKK